MMNGLAWECGFPESLCYGARNKRRAGSVSDRRQARSPPVANARGSPSQLPLHPELMKVMRHLVLVLQKPVDARLVFHRFMNHFRGRFAMDIEQRGVIELAG